MKIMKVLNTIIQILFWKVRWKKNEKENEPKYFHQRCKVFVLQKSMYEAILFRIKERFFIPQPQHVEQKAAKWFPKLWILFELYRADWSKSHKETDRKNDCFGFSEWKMKTRFQWLWFDMQRYHVSAKEEISLQLPYISKVYRTVLCKAFCRRAKFLEKILSDWE